jgi:hypothetical protein
VVNTLAYYDAAKVTAVKSFIVQAPVRTVIKMKFGTIINEAAYCIAFFQVLSLKSKAKKEEKCL